MTLVVLEIILGIDNLIFIAILADKLPPAQRDTARRLGLALALVMRLGLLASISWVMELTRPLFSVFSLEISWRDLILILGGAFLLIKATIEIHDRLEAVPHGQVRSGAAHAAFWSIVAQIAVIVMLVASKPLSAFLNAHPSLVILCLGFLLMIGLVLVIDGLGYHIPKGYLYTAIAFSVLIETFNQVALRNRRKLAARVPFRQRAAEAVLRLIGGVPLRGTVPIPAEELLEPPAAEPKQDAFEPAEKEMVRGVLTLADRPVQSVMTLRPEVVWIDPAGPKETTLAAIRDSPHRHFLACRGSVDDIVGAARKEDILNLCLDGERFDLMRVVREPVTILEGTSVLRTLDHFKRRPVGMAIVLDELGRLQGIVTRTDLLEAIAGDLPQQGTIEEPAVKELGEGSLLLDGAMSAYEAQQRLDLPELPSGEFHTVAGFVLNLFGRMPETGERTDWGDWSFEVSEIKVRRISRVLARRAGAERQAAGAPGLLA